MAVIEFARNILKIKNATSSEFGSSKASVVGLMNEWLKEGKLIKGTDQDLGGTMRLGSYEAKLIKNTLISKIYGCIKIEERHRHRYEVNINFKEDFEKKGMIFSGLSPDNKLPEIIELKDHPWFIGVQFHPEFKSRPLFPHPLFSSFIKAAKINSNK
jgi:CTP synthase